MLVVIWKIWSARWHISDWCEHGVSEKTDDRESAVKTREKDVSGANVRHKQPDSGKNCFFGELVNRLGRYEDIGTIEELEKLKKENV